MLNYDHGVGETRTREWGCALRKVILSLFLALFISACVNASTPDDQAVPAAPDLTTPSARAEGPSSAPEMTWTPVLVIGTAPTQVPPTFFYTPVPTEPVPTALPASPTPMGTPIPEAYEVHALYMVDEIRGWAVFSLGHLNEADFWLGRTIDGARTWQNVTPPAFDAVHTGAVSYSADTIFLGAYALDEETAWAWTSCNTVSGQCHVPSAIWGTEDGGRSWQTLHVPTDCISEELDCIPSSLQFVDLKHGWLLMALVGRNYIQFDFYRTTDGGETWQTMPRLEGSRNVQVMKRPIFFDETFGVRLPPSYLSDPIEKIISGQLISLDITYDGGYTWQERTLQPPAGFREALEAQSTGDDQKLAVLNNIVTPPTETSALSLRIGFRQGPRNTPAFFQAYYFSRDRGLSWQVLSNVEDTFYLDEETGWRLADTDGMILEKTTDGGVTWKPFPPMSWDLEYEQGTRKVVKLTDGGATRTEIRTQFFDDRLWPGQGVRLESLHMQDALEGWAEEIGGATLCTEDGAQTWQPCLVPEESIPTEAVLPDTEDIWSPDEPLPAEMFHGEPVPVDLQRWMEQSRQFLPDIKADDVYFNPFAYFCKTQDVDPMGDDRVGVARRCLIRYPTEEGRVYFFLAGYWMYYYSTTIRDGEHRVWPNVVNIDFINDKEGWRLLDLGTELFRLEKTEDGGETWSLVKTVAWIGQLEFVSPEEGWVLALEPLDQGIPWNQYVEDPLRPLALLHTTDGGQTWQEIVPVIGP